MNLRGKILVGCAAVLTLLAVVGYLFIHHLGGNSVMEQENDVPPGKLIGITYSYTDGMVNREEFFIKLSPEAIQKTLYWPALDPETAEDEDWYHRSSKENVPITEAQWSDVEQIILELYPLMKPIPENLIKIKLPPLFPVRDGVAATDLTLTWSTEDGIRSIRYHRPNDRRIHTLTTLLKELADPIGREIPRYDPPELIGFTIIQSGSIFAKDYSFQLTQGSSDIYGEDAPYELFAHFTPPGQKSQKDLSNWVVADAVWDDFSTFAREIGLEEQPDGDSGRLYCNLYYSDGKQKKKKLDKKTAELIREYFTDLTLQLMDDES